VLWSLVESILTGWQGFSCHGIIHSGVLPQICIKYQMLYLLFTPYHLM